MKENDHKTKNDDAENISPQFTVPRIFQHSKLFDELGIQRLWDRKKLINKLNHVNFTDGHVSIVLNNKETNEQILINAYPQPCTKDNLVCRLDTETNLNNPENYNPVYLMIEDGHTTILAVVEIVGKTDDQIQMTLPEKCYSITMRRTKRYRCTDITCKVIQGDHIFPGLLMDFAPSGLGIKLTGNKNMKGFDEKKSVLINLSRGRVKLFSGLCKCIRNDVDLPDGRMVFVPLDNQMALFPKREVRNPRQHIVPSFSMSFKHPLFRGTVERDIFDISPAGFSIKDKIDEETLLPGMIIPNIKIVYAGILKINCCAQVVYRREDRENNIVQCGLAIMDIDVHSYSQLNHILGSYLDSNARVSTEVEMDALWEFFFDTGFIYGEKYEHLQPYRELFKETYRKLYCDNPAIARHFTYENNGKIYGHMSMVHAYNPAWIIHHFAARPLDNKMTGLTILNQIMHFINGFFRFPSSAIEYLIAYYRPENNVMDRIFGTFTSYLGNSKGCSQDLFSYLLFQKNTVNYKLSTDLLLRECYADDFGILENFYESHSGGLMLEAFRLDSSLAPLGASFTKAGFNRSCKTFCLYNGSQQAAFFIVNHSDLGLNLSDLLNGIIIIVVDDKLPWEIIKSAISDLSNFYQEDRVPLLVYPSFYLSEQGITDTKIYRLWILKNNPYSDQYTEYMIKNFRMKYKSNP